MLKKKDKMILDTFEGVKAKLKQARAQVNNEKKLKIFMQNVSFQLMAVKGFLFSVSLRGKKGEAKNQPLFHCAEILIMDP